MFAGVEDFDHVLDAREPGEPIEHATLTDGDFDRRTLGIERWFIVGDGLFGYPVQARDRLGLGRRHAQRRRRAATAPRTPSRAGEPSVAG